MTGSNRRPPACKAGALPAELIPQRIKGSGMVGLVGLEPTTPALSRRCSNQLSYRPTHSLKARTRFRHVSLAALDVLSRPSSRPPGSRSFTIYSLLCCTADKCGRKNLSAHLASTTIRVLPCKQGRDRKPRFSDFQKGGDPAAPSDTATLLRLHPSHEPCRGNRPPCG